MSWVMSSFLWMRLVLTSLRQGDCGRNIIGHRAIINVPGQRGGNITMCAAISQNGVVHHHATLGPYNTAHIITFLDALHDMLTNVQRPEQTRYVIIWDNVSFHRAALVRNWFTDHPLFFFFCYQQFFFIFIFSQTTQHNIQNKTKQNSRHILNISKFNQKGGREGRTTRTQKLLL